MSGAIAGIAISLGTTAMSFIGAGKEKRKMADAKRAAAMAMAEVEKELTKNEMDALSINKEAYEIMEDQVDAQVATQMAANREGDQRGAIVGANRAQAGNLEAAGQIRTAMGTDLGDLEKLSADEATRKSDIRTQIKLGEAGGAQRAAAEASDARSQLNQQALAGVGNVVQGAVSLIPTYGMSKDARQVKGMQSDFKKAEKEKFLAANPGKSGKDFNNQYSPSQFQAGIGATQFGAEQFQQFGMTGKAGGLQPGQFSDVDFDALSALQPAEFQAAMLEMTPQQRMMIQQQMGL